ncbi:zinc-dependent metalloprotease [Nakamurella sp. A5-74]|uniref:Zinc-dependent metalloprotease n=1 Tax=Nakamurella sp. A5-74 TaxID=3158264 RepID=A0AAU8DRT7_9ACTN
MSASVVDWAGAVRTGARLAPLGPRLTPAEAGQVVDELRTLSAVAELTVREVTGLGAGLPVAQAHVVDRPGWVAATAEGMALLTEPLERRLQRGSDRPQKVSSVGGSQVGAVLGFLSGKVLGQFDPVVGEGRLLLVAPNIVKVERELQADPTDFRMWVCLHESTHRLQFTAVPWLREYFRDLTRQFGEAADLDAGELVRRLRSALGRNAATGESWIERVQTPAQREIFDEVMALMTLLEGHADHVMDAVGPRVIPSVGAIRRSFTERRRKGSSPMDRLLRSLLGMDVKMSQYVKGEKFVSAVVGAHGMAAFNQVWTSPETLPTRDEIADPEAWAQRVLS